MHKTLQRHLKRIYGEVELAPSECKQLVEVISKILTDYDKERSLIERSLEISSSELTESNQQLREEIIDANRRAKEMEYLNKMMVDRELKMVELKKEIVRLQEIIDNFQINKI